MSEMLQWRQLRCYNRSSSRGEEKSIATGVASREGENNAATEVEEMEGEKIVALE